MRRPIAVDTAQHPFCFRYDRQANKGVFPLDDSDRTLELRRIVGSQIADDEVSIDREHGGASPRPRSQRPFPPMFLVFLYRRACRGPPPAASPARRKITPSAVSSTMSRVPGSQRRRWRMAFSKITWPLVDTVVVSTSDICFVAATSVRRK